MAQTQGKRPARSVPVNKKGRSFTLWLSQGGVKSSLAGRDYYDYNLLATVILLSCFGLVMLYSTVSVKSASVGTLHFGFFEKQALFSAVAMVGMIIVSQYFDYHKLTLLSPYLYMIAVVLLVATHFFGEEVNGAKRWIKLGPIQFQTAEIAKIALILLLPEMICIIGKQIRNWRSVVVLAVTGIIAAGFTYYFTENLSSAVILAGITFGVVCIAHPKGKWFALIAAIALVILVIFGIQWIDSIPIDDTLLERPFRIQRLVAWRHPEQVSDTIAYQTLQALYAIGSGGFFGKGLGASQQKLGAVPEAQNDMIFSIVCEELGVFGALIIILLFVFLLYRLYFIATNAPDLKGSLIVAGIFIHIALQVVLNIAVVTNLLPNTGITLPFVSYGGTAVVFLMAEIGIALNVSKQIEFK